MLGWLRKKDDPTTRLRRRYEALLKEARDLQRNGDIRGFADKSAEADAVRRDLERVEAANGAR